MGEDGKHHADFTNFNGVSRRESLEQLLTSYEALADGQNNWICNLANASSLLWHAYKSLPLDINWAGFYVQDKKDKGQLILGPFQGKVACQTIKNGKGVCGMAASTGTSQVVPDVNKFPGHIACDGETKSEIVVPLVDGNGNCLGVIDIDCLEYEGFTNLDREYLERLAALIIRTCDFE